MRAGYIYSLYDVKTGELLHRGTPEELVKQGVLTRRDDASHGYLNQCRKGRLPRKWRIEREEDTAHRKKAPKREPDRPKYTQKRRIWVYSLYDAEKKLMAKGTARELVDAGRFGCTQDVANAYYAKQSIERGIYSLTRKMTEMYVPYKQPGAKINLTKAPEKAAEAKCGAVIRGIENPDALQKDVHALCCYNAEARRAGRKELSYGAWAAKGKPERPND